MNMASDAVCILFTRLRSRGTMLMVLVVVLLASLSLAESSYTDASRSECSNRHDHSCVLQRQRRRLLFGIDFKGVFKKWSSNKNKKRSKHKRKKTASKKRTRKEKPKSMDKTLFWNTLSAECKAAVDPSMHMALKMDTSGGRRFFYRVKLFRNSEGRFLKEPRKLYFPKHDFVNKHNNDGYYNWEKQDGIWKKGEYFCSIRRTVFKTDTGDVTIHHWNIENENDKVIGQQVQNYCNKYPTNDYKYAWEDYGSWKWSNKMRDRSLASSTCVLI